MFSKACIYRLCGNPMRRWFVTNVFSWFLDIYAATYAAYIYIYIYIYIYMVSLMLVRAQDAIIVIKLTFSNDFDTLEWGRLWGSRAASGQQSHLAWLAAYAGTMRRPNENAACKFQNPMRGPQAPKKRKEKKRNEKKIKEKKRKEQRRKEKKRK